jgi:hypothetical protein
MARDRILDAAYRKQRRARRLRCIRCNKLFNRPQRGRLPDYCSQSCRQRAYESRRALGSTPSFLLQHDMDDIRTKDGIKRAVVDVLRELGFLAQPLPQQRTQPRLRIVEDDEDGQGD